jgi:hypothetical protein
MFKFNITLDHHNAIQNLNYYVLLDPPHFSLPSTFKASRALSPIQYHPGLSFLPSQHPGFPLSSRIIRHPLLHSQHLRLRLSSQHHQGTQHPGLLPLQLSIARRSSSVFKSSSSSSTESRVSSSVFTSSNISSDSYFTGISASSPRCSGLISSKMSYACYVKYLGLFLLITQGFLFLL